MNSQLFVIVLIALVPASTLACSCMRLDPSAPHNTGCKGEFLAIVNITAEVTFGEDLGAGKQYPFILLADYTPNLAEHRSLADYKHFQTGIYSAVCGVELEVNTIYLIKAQLDKEPHLNLCNTYASKLAQRPTHTEASQLFAELYQRFC